MTTTEQSTRNEAALAAAIERFNAGDLPAYLRLYADDVVVHGLGPEPLTGSGVSAFYEGLFAAFPGCRVDLHETFGDGDRLVSRFTLTGRHGGDFMGVPPTGRDVVLPGITILHFREQRCVERWVTSDMLGLLVQLGAVPPPA